jgi:hypothetical protein
VTQSFHTIEAGEPRTGYVIPLFHPKADLGASLAPKVALLKAILGIDEHGQLTKPIPPQSFFQDLFTYIMCGKVWQRTRKPPKARLRTLVKRAEAATGKTVTAITTLADGVKLDLGTGKPEPAEPENPWPLDEFRTKDIKQ